jgi:hypothetical protein
MSSLLEVSDQKSMLLTVLIVALKGLNSFLAKLNCNF